MYSGSRRILIQGAVSDAVQSTSRLAAGVKWKAASIKALTQANMQVNPKGTGRLPPVRITSRDLGVDTQ
eukprot:1504955-Amphidinium_carterae.2